MPTYRIQIPAVILFSIEAGSPQTALKLAEQVRNENYGNEWDVDLSLAGEFDTVMGGRAYVDEDAIRNAPLTPECIVDEERPGEPVEPHPPESCAECGSAGVFNLLGVDVGGADRQAFVCDNCGHAHFLN